MSTLSLSSVARRSARARAFSRRPCRFALLCESLEFRQLLSTFQGSHAASAVVNQPVAQPTLPAAPLFGNGTPTGLSPAQVTTAYGVNQISFNGVKGNGTGQTIAIIDAYFDPNIASDLRTFDTEYGLPAPPNFTQAVQVGLFQDNAGWALETSLDVEWAHAIAPAANILLVEAQPYLNTLFSAVTYATQQPSVSVVSMSWGTNEFAGESQYDSTFTTPAGHGGITFVAASGDSGTTLYPSASPNVLSVGGTTLSITSQGSYNSETAWSGSGGGYSPYEPEPSWQAGAISASGLNSGSRTTPDIAWDANPSTGVSVYDSVRYYGQSGWFTVGGTSVGAPSWSALLAIANQGLALNQAGSLAGAQTSLYSLPASDYHEITSGSNGYYSAGPGYNLVTGLGSPKANVLVPALVSLGSSAAGGSPLSSPLKVPSRDPGSSPPVGSTTSNDNGNGAGTGANSSNNSSSTTSSSITPLNSNTPSNGNTQSVTPVFFVPAPLPPIVIHLAASAPPVTAQSLISTQEEQPTSLTQFGQGPEIDSYKLLGVPSESSTPVNAPIDIVEPFQPADLPEAPKGERDGLQGAFRPWGLFAPSGPDSDSAMDLTASRLLPESWSGKSFRTNDGSRGTSPSWGLSTLFGVFAVASGGYRIALGERGQFSGRWLSGRLWASRRRPGNPSL